MKKFTFFDTNIELLFVLGKYLQFFFELKIEY